jgi:hypothetical protein
LWFAGQTTVLAKKASVKVSGRADRAVSFSVQAPTLAFKALFDFAELTANCKGQAAAPGEGTKFGDYCVYV